MRTHYIYTIDSHTQYFALNKMSFQCMCHLRKLYIEIEYCSVMHTLRVSIVALRIR